MNPLRRRHNIPTLKVRFNLHYILYFNNSSIVHKHKDALSFFAVHEKREHSIFSGEPHIYILFLHSQNSSTIHYNVFY